MKRSALFFCSVALYSIAWANTSQAEEKDCMETAQTQAEMTQCMTSKARAADQELNQVYRAIRKQYQHDPDFLTALSNAQRAWLRFRDAELKMKYPKSPEQYGSNFSMCRNNELEALTRTRIATLKRWQAGAEEGNVCAGSIQLIQN